MDSAINLQYKFMLSFWHVFRQNGPEIAGRTGNFELTHPRQKKITFSDKTQHRPF